MKQPLLIANWKSNMTESEAFSWLEGMKDVLSTTEKQIVVCPPFTLLPLLQKKISTEQIPLQLGAQDISPFEKGAYTGAMNGEQIAEFASYVLIGHSERRKYFFETDEQIEQKVAMAKKANLITVECVQDINTPIPEGVNIVAYEPVWAIGSGKAESAEQANSVAVAIKEKSGVPLVLYGGSVTAENVHEFSQMDGIDGVLVGGASLIPQKFSQLIQNA
jgi:triosephosphate isomerase